MNIFIDDGGSGGGGGGYTTSGLVLYLDAGSTSSYSGSGQVWQNLVASPADSSAQTAYDYNRGTTSGSQTSDPTFVGTAGVDPCYFWFDGGDIMTLAGSATAFLSSLHKSGSKFTVELWCRMGPGAQIGNRPLFDSGTSDQGGSLMSRGVMFMDRGDASPASNRNNLRVQRDSSGGVALSVSGTTPVSDAADQMIACSIDGTGTDPSFLYTNGAYDQVAGSNTFTGTLSSPGSTNTANASRIGGRGDAAQVVQNGTRIHLVRIYNRNLTKTELDANWNNERARFGL